MVLCLTTCLLRELPPSRPHSRTRCAQEGVREGMDKPHSCRLSFELRKGSSGGDSPFGSAFASMAFGRHFSRWLRESGGGGGGVGGE